MSITTPAEAEQLPPGQWIYDNQGEPYCLVDTNVGWPQRMAMHAATYIALDHLAYPLTLAELDEDCKHTPGPQECGHCRRCGQVIGPPQERNWHFVGFTYPGAAS